MNDKILSISDCEYIEKRLALFNSSVVNWYEQYSRAIKFFESNATVQSLYDSGNYGINLKEHLEKVRETMTEYFQVLSNGPDSLVNQTKKYISSQKDLLLASARGYTATDSIKARRVGNQE